MRALWPVVGLVLLAACSTAPAVYRPVPWSAPLVTVSIPSTAPTCAALASELALGFLTPRRPHVIRMVPGPIPLGQVRPGEIAVWWEEPEGTAAAMTKPWRDGSRARVRIHTCDPRPWAHEFGHALGLAHREVPGALMNPYLPTMGWSLTAEERAILEHALESP